MPGLRLLPGRSKQIEVRRLTATTGSTVWSERTRTSMGMHPISLFLVNEGEPEIYRGLAFASADLKINDELVEGTRLYRITQILGTNPLYFECEHYPFEPFVATMGLLISFDESFDLSFG